MRRKKQEESILPKRTDEEVLESCFVMRAQYVSCNAKQILIDRIDEQIFCLKQRLGK